MRAGAIGDPKKYKRWLIALAAVYLIFPRDLLPDYIGRGLGFVDDVLVIGFLNHFYRKRLREFNAQAAGPRQGEHSRSAQQPASSAATADPYTTLGVSASASQQTIRSAYRARMNEYHPDKVAHLGDELQKLAHRTVLEIQEAYRQLRR